MTDELLKQRLDTLTETVGQLMEQLNGVEWQLKEHEKRITQIERELDNAPIS
jgi:predicted  nucleic acid-binding Zn-ribbon protein